MLLLPSPQELGLDVPCNFPVLGNLLEYNINNAVGSLKTCAACESNMSLIYIKSSVYSDLSLSFSAKGCCLSHKQVPQQDFCLLGLEQNWTRENRKLTTA